MALRLTRFARARAQGTRRTPETGAEGAPHRASNRARIMVGLVLGVAAVGLLVMDRSAGPPVATLPTPPLEGEPDIYMAAPVVYQYRPDGSLEYRLVAENASHFQQDALTRLTAPHLSLLQDDDPPWNITARQGILSRPAAGADAESVALEGDVMLEHTLADGERVRLVTQALRLYPRRQYAETDQDVMIESLFGRTRATGLEGDLRLGVLNLFSAEDRPVQTILQPEHFK